jgi:hypothetical protein
MGAEERVGIFTSGSLFVLQVVLPTRYFLLKNSLAQKKNYKI